MGLTYGVPRAAGKRVIIIGGGNSPGQAAMFFADRATSVTVLVRGEDLEAQHVAIFDRPDCFVPSIRVDTETQVVRSERPARLGRRPYSILRKQIYRASSVLVTFATTRSSAFPAVRRRQHGRRFRASGTRLNREHAASARGQSRTK